MLFCELMYRSTSAGSPTINLPLYICPPEGCAGLVLLRDGTDGRGRDAGVDGERRGEGENGADWRLV